MSPDLGAPEVEQAVAAAQTAFGPWRVAEALEFGMAGLNTGTAAMEGRRSAG